MMSMQIKLNCIEPKVFPLPMTIARESRTPETLQQPAQESFDMGPLIPGSNLMKYSLRPAARVDTVESTDQPLSIPTIQQELKTGQHSC